MESFLPSTVKQWNTLPDYIKNAPGICSFKSLLKSHFCRKSIELFNFGKRKYNIIHCQIRNNASNLKADLYNQHLAETPMCEHCTDCIENAYHYFIVCPKYTIPRDVLFQSTHNIISCDNIPECDLFLNGSPNHGLDINIQIFEAVHTFIAATKRFI